MKILLTGSSGFVGFRLGMSLIQERHVLVGYDLQNGDDIRHRYKLEYLFETSNFDAVIHCAALAGVRRSELYAEEYISTNIVGTKNLIDLSEKYGVSHFISFSSSSVYGGGNHNEPLKEDDEKKPISIYGMTKLMAEQIVNRASIPTTIVRPFTVYGENGREDQLIKKWVSRIKAGKPITIFKEDDKFPARGYTYVGDLIEGVLRILKRDLSKKHETYNLGGDTLVNVQMVADVLQDVCRELDLVYWAEMVQKPKADPMCNFADTEKARKELGWKPKTDFYAKIREIFKEELKNGRT